MLKETTVCEDTSKCTLTSFIIKCSVLALSFLPPVFCSSLSLGVHKADRTTGPRPSLQSSQNHIPSKHDLATYRCILAHLSQKPQNISKCESKNGRQINPDYHMSLFLRYLLGYTLMYVYHR